MKSIIKKDIRNIVVICAVLGCLALNIFAFVWFYFQTRDNFEVLNQATWVLAIVVVSTFLICSCMVFFLIISNLNDKLSMSNSISSFEKSYSTALSHMQCIVFEYDRDTDTIKVLNSLFGINAGQVMKNIRKRLETREIIHPRDKETWEEILRNIDEGNDVPITSIRMKIGKGDKEYNWFRFTLTNSTPENEQPRFYIGTIDDIAEIKKTEIQKAREMHFREAMLSNAIGSYEINLSENVILKNTCSDKTEDYNEKMSYDEFLPLLARNVIFFDDTENLMQAFNREILIASFERGDTEQSFEYRRKAEDAYRWARCDITLLRDNYTEDVISIWKVSDIQEEKMKELMLLKKAEIDSLTELYNRETITRKSNEYLEDSGDKHLNAFLLIDVDNFKEINDSFGHIVGDKLLVEIAVEMQRIFRSVDLTSRFGGDEFVVFMKDITNPAIAEHKALQFINEVKMLRNRIDPDSIHSCSIGVAYSYLGARFDELYAAADKALYHAKSIGKGTYEIYSTKK